MVDEINSNATEKLVPRVKSRFLKIKCPKCGNTQIIFSHVSRSVKCVVCGEVLARPTGGKAEILAEVLEVLD